MQQEDTAEPNLPPDMPCNEHNPWISSSVAELEPEHETTETQEDNANLEAQDQNLYLPEPESTPILYGPLPRPSGTFPSPVSSQTGLFDSVPTLAETKDELDPANATAGACGLRNMGNTCFMNSGLQCLMCNPSLLKYILEEYGPKGEKYEEISSLTAQFTKLVQRAWSGKYTVLHPSIFKQTLGFYHSQFEDFRQHDCQEFLALLLDSLHVQLNQSKYFEATGNSLCAIEKSCDQEVDESAANQSSPSTSQVDLISASVCKPEESVKSSPEDSNQSVATSEDMETDLSYRNVRSSLPDLIPTFSDPTENERLNNDLTGAAKVGALENVLGTDGSTTRNLPTIEDLYMKDTKVLNTNVLQEYEETNIATDSEKYVKQDNTDRHRESLLEEFPLMESLGESHAEALHGMSPEALAQLVEKGEPMTPLKESNLFANYKEKSDNCFGKTLFNGDEDSDPESHINNIKRMKIDSEFEKNFRKNKSSGDNDFDSSVASTSATCSKDYVMNNSAENSPRLKKRDSNEFANRLHGEKNVMNNTRSLVGAAAAMETNNDVLTEFNNEAHMMAQYRQEAEREWAKYVQRNQSVIVDTFQGQFKSTVVCSECYHISVTFEPFMYLSVPIPHANEKQITVIFVSCDKQQPMRYLVTLNKNGKVEQLKSGLRSLIGEEESCDLVIAEVFEKHISRILDNHTLLRYVNDCNRTVYAFEMLPPPTQQQDEESTNNGDVITNVADDCDVTMSSQSDVMGNRGEVTGNLLPNNVTSSTCASATAVCGADDECLVSSSTAPSSAATSASTSHISEILNNSVSSSSSVIGALESRPDVNWQTNLLTEENYPECTSSSSSTSHNATHTVTMATAGEGFSEEDGGNNKNDKVSSSYFSGYEPDLDATIEAFGNAEGALDFDTEFPPMDHIISSGKKNCNSVSSGSELQSAQNGGNMKSANQGQTDHETGEAVSQITTETWKSCAICLEEMSDNELMIHPSCGGTLCHGCLEMSVKHYAQGTFMCPVCSTNVDPSEEYIQLECMADYKPKTRILSVPIMQRHAIAKVDGTTGTALFGHPSLLYLPSQLSGELLYSSVDRVAPVLAPYTVVLTDAQGSRCSRCMYMDKCFGCTISRDQHVSLQPGDHLTIHYSGLSEDLVEDAGRHTDHSSMRGLRSDDPITLFDCFKAFTQSETLDENNPWYCPRCRKNQCASKTITVWKYPNTLVVYLKRFVFEQLTGTKINTPVVFPLETLDVSEYVSGPRHQPLLYNLQSFVCHFGGTASGHYTAYGRHPLSDDWYYYNDEMCSQQAPGPKDQENAYVLFYQRQGEKTELHIPECLDDELAAASAANSQARSSSAAASATTLDAEHLGTQGAQQFAKSAALNPQGPADPASISRALETLSRDVEMTSSEEPDSTGATFDFYE